MEIAYRLCGHGYDMLLAQPANEQMERLKRGLLTDGLIVMDVLWEDERLPELRQAFVPVVLMGAPGENPGLDVVDFDYRTAGTLAIEYLIGLGHRHVALVSGPRGLNSVARVEAGALSAIGPAPGGQLTIIPGQAASPASIAAELETIRECTAVILHDQHQLPVLMDAISGLGIRVPEELSVIAIATHGTLQRCRPVTTIAVPVDAIARQSVDAVISAVRGGAPTRSLIAPQLTDRGSCSAPGLTANRCRGSSVLPMGQDALPTTCTAYDH